MRLTPWFSDIQIIFGNNHLYLISANHILIITTKTL